ncbi:MAG: GTPase, partial [Isosphaeraceae bacterium]|nr:GTPase [Isosphaeraceae bacterium]
LLAYIAAGGYWLWITGWGGYAFLASIAVYTLFAILAERWTRSQRKLLPPIDWGVPSTFTPFDRQAWALVEEEAEKGDTIPADQLLEVDLYIETGRRLAQRLAAHYHPLSTNPIEHVPVVEILTSLELAAEDLVELCREIPGGDLVTYAHWKRAVQASTYLSRANEIYTYLLPLFQPMTGIVRLGTQKLMVQPAWRSMQQNLLRWFYRAFVNRLGFHLVELYSGRLAIGAEQYRRLTRRAARKQEAAEEGLRALVIAVVGARDAGKSLLIKALERQSETSLAAIRARLEAGGFEPDLADRLKEAVWVEVDGYTIHPGGESARDRQTRRAAVEVAVESDLLLLVLDGRREDFAPDTKFLAAWEQWFASHPGLEIPPALAVVTGADRLGPSGDGAPTRAATVQARVEAVRRALPKVVADVVAVGLGTDPPTGVTDRLLPALASLLHRADRVNLIRHLYHMSTRSKARRLLTQVGRQGRRLWEGLKSARRARSHPPDAQSA